MRRILSLLLFISALLIGIAGVSCFLFYQMSTSTQLIAHTQEVLYTQSEVASRLQDMNLASRGYAFAGKKSLLIPYDDGVKRLGPTIEHLRELTVDNALQQQQIGELKTSCAKFREVTDKLIATRDPELVDAHKGFMDEIRHQLDSIVKEETRLLSQRKEDSTNYFRLGLVVLGIEIVVGLGLLSVSWSSIKGYTAESLKQIEKLESEVEQRRKTEEALKQTTLNLTRSNHDLQQFAYVASHDLQEPLRAVTGFLTLLQKKQEGNLDADSQTYINFAVEGALRMRTLVNDLLAYARVESRAKEFEELDLDTVLTQVQRDLSVSIAENNVKLIVPDLPKVKGDATQLAQVFLNLIGNAIKFHGEAPPVIEIRYEKRPEDWLFSVKDNGRGFEMEHAERIFVIFQRLQGRDQAPGTGIGLALVKKIIERHGGTIWVESTPDVGTTFYFTLPHL